MDYRDTETYKDLHKRYEKGASEDIIVLYTLHDKMICYEGDFHFIGKKVCGDILTERDQRP